MEETDIFKELPNSSHECKTTHTDKGPPWWQSQRFILAVFLFFGNVNLFIQRVNFSIVIICMVNHTALRYPQDTYHEQFTFSTLNYNVSTDEANKSSVIVEKNISIITGKSLRKCGIENGGDLTEREDGPFVWDKQTQGLLLGALYWTYLIVQYPGNHLVRRLRKKQVTVVVMTVMAATSCVCHGAALLSPWALFVARLVHGTCTALAIFSMYGMWTTWAPPAERAALISFMMSGQIFGNVLSLPLAGLLCQYGPFGGWPSVFYVSAISCLLWVAAFAVVAAEKPDTNKFITEAEKLYIINSLSSDKPPNTGSPPYGAMLRSPATWGQVCGHTSFTWGFFLLLNCLPQYFLEVLHFDVQSNGVLSMLPYICLMLFVQVSGPLSDRLIKKKFLRVSSVRKIYILTGNLVPAMFMTGLSYLDCDSPVLAVTLLSLGVGFSGLTMVTILVTPYDMAAHYGPTLMTISNTVATLPGIITPYIVAAITVDQTREQWQTVFFLTAAVLSIGCFGFCFMARFELQSWALGIPQIEYVIEDEEVVRELVVDNNSQKE